MYFLDTNILVYLFDPAAPAKSACADRLVRAGLASGEAAISYQVVQEFLNVALRKFTVPLRPEDARSVYGAILKPLTRVEYTPALVQDALVLLERYSLSWYDALIVAAALQLECETLYSEDLQAGLRIGKLTVVNPFAV